VERGQSGEPVNCHMLLSYHTPYSLATDLDFLLLETPQGDPVLPIQESFNVGNQTIKQMGREEPSVSVGCLREEEMCDSLLGLNTMIMVVT
jgi:lysine/ornithine N-monooxygenase